MLRAALPTFLVVSLGCSQPARTPADAGPLVLRPVEGSIPRELPGVSPAASGVVEGRTLWVGPRPALQPLSTNASVESVCGRTVPDLSLQLGPDGGVAAVVVWVDAPPEPAPPSVPGPPVLLDQRACNYLPPALAARAGTSLRLRNSDPLTHTVHAVAGGQTLFNLAMPLEQMELLRPLPARPGVVEIRCDIHPWMRATVRTFDHPHFTTTDPTGHYRLPALAPGEVEVHAWHPRLGERMRKVRVGEGVAQIDFDFGGAR